MSKRMFEIRIRKNGKPWFEGDIAQVQGDPVGYENFSANAPYGVVQVEITRARRKDGRRTVRTGGG